MKKNNTKTNDFIPALKYPWLTRFYDPVLNFTMPERKFKAELIRQAGIRSNHHVLDFGCGSATLSLMLKMTKPQTVIRGVDVDDKNIAIAKRKIGSAQADIYIDKYDGVVLPYADNSFDRVLSSLVFHHLDAGQKANSFTEIKRVLKPGGELHIADWGKPSNIVMRSAFYFVQLLDGFKTTSDNVKGLLPVYMTSIGFKDVISTTHFDTIFGTLRLMKATK